MVVPISVEDLLDLAWNLSSNWLIVDLAAEEVIQGVDMGVWSGVAREIKWRDTCVPAISSPIFVEFAEAPGCYLLDGLQENFKADLC